MTDRYFAISQKLHPAVSDMGFKQTRFNELTPGTLVCYEDYSCKRLLFGIVVSVYMQTRPRKHRGLWRLLFMGIGIDDPGMFVLTDTHLNDLACWTLASNG